MEQNIKSNSIALRDFINNSIIWADIQGELIIWLNDIRDQLENSSGDLSPRVMDRLGGNAESVRNLLALPQIMLETLEADSLMNKK